MIDRCDRNGLVRALFALGVVIGAGTRPKTCACTPHSFHASFVGPRPLGASRAHRRTAPSFALPKSRGGGLNSVDGGLVRFVSEKDVSSAWRTSAAQVAAVLLSCRSGCCRPTSLLRPPAESSPTGRSSRGGPRLARYLPAFRTSSCRLWLGDSLETAPPAGSPSPSARRRWRWTRCAATRW